MSGRTDLARELVVGALRGVERDVHMSPQEVADLVLILVTACAGAAAAGAKAADVAPEDYAVMMFDAIEHLARPQLRVVT